MSFTEPITTVVQPPPAIQTTLAFVGPRGPTGPAGSGGGSGDLNFTHEQVSAAATWTITHNLGKMPSVTVIDSGGSGIVGSVTYPSVNQLVIEFSAPFAGFAYLN